MQRVRLWHAWSLAWPHCACCRDKIREHRTIGNASLLTSVTCHCMSWHIVTSWHVTRQHTWHDYAQRCSSVSFSYSRLALGLIWFWNRNSCAIGTHTERRSVHCNESVWHHCSHSLSLSTSGRALWPRWIRGLTYDKLCMIWQTQASWLSFYVDYRNT